jgi:hypothetical protein
LVAVVIEKAHQAVILAKILIMELTVQQAGLVLPAWCRARVEKAVNTEVGVMPLMVASPVRAAEMEVTQVSGTVGSTYIPQVGVVLAVTLIRVPLAVGVVWVKTSILTLRTFTQPMDKAAAEAAVGG